MVMATIRDVTSTHDANGQRRYAMTDDGPFTELVSLEPESLKLKIGCLEIQTGPHACKGTFLADGKPLPDLRSLCLRFDFATVEQGGTDGMWKVTAEILPLEKT